MIRFPRLHTNRVLKVFEGLNMVACGGNTHLDMIDIIDLDHMSPLSHVSHSVPASRKRTVVATTACFCERYVAQAD